MSLLELHDIRSTAHGVETLRGADLAVEAGELLALVGPRRSGKSTLLRAMAGLVRVSGTVRFDGETVARPSPRTMARLGVAHVAAGPLTFGDLTVADQLRLGAWSLRGPLDNAYARVFEVVPFLYERRRRRAGSLPAGEQRLLAVARAAMARPRLLLCDEPSHGLGRGDAAEVRAALDRVSEWGTAIVVAEQGGRAAPAGADRVLAVVEGRVAAVA